MARRENFVDDDTLIDLITRLGMQGAATETGYTVRNINYRRKDIEARNKIKITPGGGVQDYSTRHPERLTFHIDDGWVLVASDAHYWPKVISTAHCGFVRACRELKPKLVIMNGDVFDGASVSRHAPIGWEGRPTVQQEIEACSERLDEIRKAAKNAQFVWTLGNHDCLDPETECLTQRGWLRHDQLTADDCVLSRMPDGSGEWSPITEVVRFPFNGELVRVERTRLSMAVTPNHRIMLKRLNWRTAQYDIAEFRRADDLPYSFNIPTSCQVQNVGASLSDDQLRLAGWVLTDGSYTDGDPHKGISIYQSKPAGVAEIEALLLRLAIPFSRYERQRERRAVKGRELKSDPLPSVQFFIKAEARKLIAEWLPRKGVMPAWVHDLSARQFAIFLDALVAGDGVWDGNVEKRECCVLYGQRPILEDLQAVAVQHGWRARVTIDNRGDPRLCLAKGDGFRVEKPHIFHERHEGVVWCLRVPHENFMVRRNGSAYFTGNSRFESRLAQVAPEYARVHGVHLKDHFPEWQPCWSIWINDEVVVKHRFKGGIHATHNGPLWSGKTIITGHLHSLKATPLTDYNGTRWGVDTGTLADPFGPQFEYQEDNPRNHRSGFVALRFVDGQMLQPQLAMVVRDGVIDFMGRLYHV